MITQDDARNIPPGGITGVNVIRQALQEMSSSAGVYRMLDEEGAVLYVGKARVLKNRVASYANLTQLSLRMQRMVMATRTLEVTLAATEAEALLLEAHLIKTLKPRYNIQLRDDKSYPYIHLSGNHPFPRISKYRGAKEGKGEYFGPFASAGAVDETIALLQKAFLLRPCSDNVFKNRSRPCLQYQIRRCSAPCVAKISEQAYGEFVSEAKQLLHGKGGGLHDRLASEMQEASERTEYERAAQLRDRLRALTQIQRQVRAGAGLEEVDMIALAREGSAVGVHVAGWRGGTYFGGRDYFPAAAEDVTDAEMMAAFIGQYYQRQMPPERVLVSVEPEGAGVLAEALSLLAKRKVEILLPQRGDKRSVVEQTVQHARAALLRHMAESGQQAELRGKLAELFGLDEAPKRIEVYDNSHVSGTHPVGAMIVAGPEGFDKKAYRLFNIKDTALTPGDDYAMLREVFSRRFRNWQEAEEASKPDLVLVDGGAGHLSAAQDVLTQLGITDIPLAAIAKGRDRNAGREWFHLPDREPFQLPAQDAVLHFLQRLRDEAHRFAIGAHRNRRSKAAQVSELDQIASIGPARKRELLKHFGSARAVGDASVADIGRVKGISRELAKKIYDHFHG